MQNMCQHYLNQMQLCVSSHLSKRKKITCLEGGHDEGCLPVRGQGVEVCFATLCVQYDRQTLQRPMATAHKHNTHVK